MNPLVVLANSKPYPTFDVNRPEGMPHPCFSCQEGYDKLIASKKLKEFPCSCKLTSDIQLDEIRKVAGDLSEEERLYLEYSVDPVAWAEFELNWKARWYQDSILRCSAKKKVIRAGRRVGKSTALGVDILHKVATGSNYRALVIAPYQDQVDLLFDNMDKLIENSLTMKAMGERRVKHPSQRIEFSNGSAIVGSTAGVKTGARANKVRGQDAHGIWLDETDMLAQEDLESILAILASHPDCSLWASGTPSGKREHFFNWCTQPHLGFKQFHYAASVSPNWTPEIEEWFRSIYSKTAFAQEFLAEFGDEIAGVYDKNLIDEALSDYDPTKRVVTEGMIYGLGVDWNDTSEGVHMVLVGWETKKGALWFERKFIVSKEQFTQTKAVEKIIEINNHWKPSFIYVDSGWGATQIEMLKSYGLKNPTTGLVRKVKGIQMGGKIQIQTPLGPVDKDIKPFIVGQSVISLQQGEVRLPKCEYKGEGTEGLVDQMMRFRIKRYSPEGRPVYDNTPDHTLTAWQLAIYGFWMEHTELGKRRPVTSVGVIHGEPDKAITDPSSIGMVTFKLTPERIKEKKAEEHKKYAPLPRNVDLKFKTGTLSDIFAAKQEKQRTNKKIGKAGFIGFYNYLAKKPQPRKKF